MSNASRVQFPRFQLEGAGKVEVAHRGPVEIAGPECHFDTQTISLLQRPRTVVAEERTNERARNNWWGVSHEAVRRKTVGNVFSVPYEDPSMPVGFRLQSISHRYLWDHQATNGDAIELVLDRYRPRSKRFLDVAAVLLHLHKPQEQRMVVRHPQDESSWVDPTELAEEDVPRRIFALDVMSRLAVCTYADIRPHRLIAKMQTADTF